ncbi:circularly permutated Ras protein 1 isoform X1 [Pleuronectes platessa]|uniref:circularly permutated Ras protein 1 isoform X1 n=1 Tax=Pleuronectes platessa TaxID=8262 RepID=UPI00232A247B|nr:circularly permutated Ras protein 1 isoform X1 [Pleuronectes platessa]XP_053271876.1 circularly permutated Ras protein 1 isoform X1 [Pleuronectes platessa]XP_053271877.1 circularly permutated Ras protein 1 isoform X1 [Pleuronectes platessa]XP_053271878.1 circularly permutated Ras protein 1 isoform X1 [Pleuronectes platessa]
MEFACSHVVCNWRSDEAASTDFPLMNHEYDNVVKEAPPRPPPVPPPRFRPRPPLPPLPRLPSFKPRHAPGSLPPPLPPREDKMEADNSLKANVNIVSLSVGQLVNIHPDTDQEAVQSPVLCGKCSAALSCLSSLQRNMWVCEFCGSVNGVHVDVKGTCTAQCTAEHSDDLYLQSLSDDDYQNLEDSLVVFCVDISGSMSVTTEVPSSSALPVYVSRLEGIQDALQRALSSMLQDSPRRRVALVTFSDEVVIYGDGTSVPLTLRDWALVDYDHIWEQGAAYSVPHCIAETYRQLVQRVKDLREHGATCLGPAALASVAMASRHPGSKVILCTDGRANIGLGEMEQTSSPLTAHFYRQLAEQAVDSGVIISVMSFEGTDCRLADVGRLADTTGGRVNIVSIGTIATEIQSASMDNVLATGVTATLVACCGIYFPDEEDESDHKLVREIGNVTTGLQITFQFAVKPEFTEVFLQRDTLPFQLQLSFKTRDQQRVTRIITKRRPVTSSSRVGVGSFNMAVLGVHGAQLCAGLTMEGRVQDAQKQLKAQQDLLTQISEQRPIATQERIYGNWMDTMSTICDDITAESHTLSDEAAELVYQMRRATSVYSSSTAQTPQKPTKKKKTFMRRK